MVRPRLYDIDVLINRTLVYATLTVSLASVYLGSIVALQYVVRALAGESSQLAVVASTLSIAVLFNPLRRRIQVFIDRSFYRSKYDAAKILEAFSARLRAETDLETLSDDLVGVARDAADPRLFVAAPRESRTARAYRRVALYSPECLERLPEKD
jgi:hypothetical protein